MGKIRYCYEFDCMYNAQDKIKNINDYVRYMLARTQSMFKYNNLPDSIPQRMLELMLQTNGNVCFYKHNGTLYVFTGGLGGEPDEYYRPTIYTVANPALKFSKNLKINEECVVMLNDSMLVGLLPMFNRYASQLTENDLSLRIADINTRIISVLSSSDDVTTASAKVYLKDVEDGKLGIIAENELLDGVKVQPNGTSNNNIITSLIEYEQYLKASWYNELGLNANYNMKRESINSQEAQLNDDALLPLIDDMLKCRKEALEKINKMFGTDISVELDSSWKDNQEEIDALQDSITDEPKKEESEVKPNDNETNETE